MWYQTMGIDDLIVDSIYLQFESDSDQPLEVYWSKSSRRLIAIGFPSHMMVTGRL